VVAAGGCGDDDDQPASAEAPSTTEAATDPPATATPSTTHPEVLDTVPTIPAKPGTCEPDMGTTLLAEFAYPPFPTYPEPPAGWTEPTSFDWDGDGADDTLTVADGKVVVDWGAGQVVVEGVVTDFFAEPGVDDDGEVFNIYDEAVAAQHVPAAVGDVTGDDKPDLVVSHGGHTAVLIGQGAATPTGTVAFDDVGRTQLGWRSPPQRPPQHYTAEGEPWGDRLLFPNPVADVAVLWDADGDGANEFSVTRWVERSAPWVVHFAGIACSLPEG
jgi:hypothetical protein